MSNTKSTKKSIKNPTKKSIKNPTQKIIENIIKTAVKNTTKPKMDSIQIYKVLVQQLDPDMSYSNFEAFSCEVRMFLDNDEAMKYAYDLAIEHVLYTLKLPYTNIKPKKVEKEKKIEKEKKNEDEEDDEEDEEEDEEDEDDEDDENIPDFHYFTKLETKLQKIKNDYLGVSNIYAWKSHIDVDWYWHNYLIKVVKDEINFKNTIINKTEFQNE